MAKFDGILLGSDLDGTLLNHDKSISKENIQAIRYFESEGGLFTFITGRIPVGAVPVLKQFTPTIPFGCINGGGIYDAVSQKMIWSMHLHESALSLVAFIDKTFPETGIELTTDNTIYCCKSNHVTKRHLKDEHLEEKLCDYTDFSLPMVKILFGEKAESIPALEKALRNHPLAGHFDFIRSDKEYFEILPKGASKGNVLLKLAELLNVDPMRTIAVGDNDNDASMLRSAALGIAVSGASASAKEAANYITVANTEHAIARIIQDLDTGRLSL